MAVLKPAGCEEENHASHLEGFLQLSHVAIPIKLYPATSSEATVSFHQLHFVCQSRLRMPQLCPKCNCEVPKKQTVKGYEYAKDKHVLIPDEELERLELPSTKAVTLSQFAAEAELDPMYFDRPYLVAPDGPMALDGYAVLRDTLRERKRVAIGKLVMGDRENLVAVVPDDHGLILHTLHYTDELRGLNALGSQSY